MVFWTRRGLGPVDGPVVRFGTGVVDLPAPAGAVIVVDGTDLLVDETTPPWRMVAETGIGRGLPIALDLCFRGSRRSDSNERESRRVASLLLGDAAVDASSVEAIAGVLLHIAHETVMGFELERAVKPFSCALTSEGEEELLEAAAIMGHSTSRMVRESVVGIHATENSFAAWRRCIGYWFGPVRHAELSERAPVPDGPEVFDAGQGSSPAELGWTAVAIDAALRRARQGAGLTVKPVVAVRDGALHSRWSYLGDLAGLRDVQLVVDASSWGRLSRAFGDRAGGLLINARAIEVMGEVDLDTRNAIAGAGRRPVKARRVVAAAV